MTPEEKLKKMERLHQIRNEMASISKQCNDLYAELTQKLFIEQQDLRLELFRPL